MAGLPKIVTASSGLRAVLTAHLDHLRKSREAGEICKSSGCTMQLHKCGFKMRKALPRLQSSIQKDDGDGMDGGLAMSEPRLPGMRKSAVDVALGLKLPKMMMPRAGLPGMTPAKAAPAAAADTSATDLAADKKAAGVGLFSNLLTRLRGVGKKGWSAPSEHVSAAGVNRATASRMAMAEPVAKAKEWQKPWEKPEGDVKKSDPDHGYDPTTGKASPIRSDKTVGNSVPPHRVIPRLRGVDVKKAGHPVVVAPRRPSARNVEDVMNPPGSGPAPKGAACKSCGSRGGHLGGCGCVGAKALPTMKKAGIAPAGPAAGPKLQPQVTAVAAPKAPAGPKMKTSGAAGPAK